MKQEDAPQYSDDQAYLTEALDYVQGQIEELQETLKVRQHLVVDMFKLSRDEEKYDMGNDDSGSPEAIFDTAADKLHIAMELKRLEKMESYTKESLEKLEKASKSPFFGRIDFCEQGFTHVQKIYIGIQSVTDERNERIFVYDWRAPISSMYYDYSTGPAEYDTLEQTISGHIDLKRQFLIKNSELLNLFEADLHIGDQLLQHMLSQHADGKMKSIVTTIQREQNQIIREESHRFLIVQGVAGSGKTSAALQRIAYLLYKHRKTINENDILMLTPNPLFGTYISTVLPELGERNVQQFTFHEYVQRSIPSDYRLEKTTDHLEYLWSRQDDVHYQTKVASMTIKGSNEFIAIIKAYLELLSKEGMEFEDLFFRDKIIISKEAIREKFYTYYFRGLLHTRLDHVKEWILEELDVQQARWQRIVYRNMRRINKYVAEDAELKKLSEQMVTKYLDPVRKKVEQGEFISIVPLYRQLFSNEDLLHKLGKSLPVTGGSWREVRDRTLRFFEQKLIPFEDVVPFMYLNVSLTGALRNSEFRYVIIDESQDYSLFHYELFKIMFRNSKATILGDLNQKVHAHSQSVSCDDAARILGYDQTRVVYMTKCYRSTQQIVNFTKAILDDGDQIEAYCREAGKPDIIRMKQEERPLRIANAIQKLQEAGNECIAIVGKHLRECRSILRDLTPHIDAKLITPDDDQSLSGVVVLPIYLAKGLEFDAVIVFNGDKMNFNVESERGLLYTACTRALHQLILIYENELSPFIGDMDPALYNHQFLGGKR